ncbi:MAG: acetylglutamate kinase [Chitinivibrionales bacterium]|nr:acetylglutamate kinase [Chitinivibrionales bacterium]
MNGRTMHTLCIKIGGSTIDSPGLLRELALGIQSILDKWFVVIIHGGGKDIKRQLDMLNKEFTFVEGMRVTDEDMLKQVQMVLSGDVNKRIVNEFLGEKVPALGFSGVDCNLIEAERMTVNDQDIGYVGTVVAVHPQVLSICREYSLVPVVSPISRGKDGSVYNVNADLAAAEIAVALKAEHLLYISDVPGVLIDNEVRREIHTNRIDELIEQQLITGGMVPKLRSAADAVFRGVGRIHICGWQGAQTLKNELEIKTSSGTTIHE